jgi:hypothetical protein
MAASDMVSTIDALIEDLLANFNNITSYRIGSKSVDKHQALEILRKMRSDYYKASIQEPYEDIKHVAYDHSDFGENESEYIGDES